MKILKEEKGSITLFVLIAMLFFAMYLVGMYMLSSSTEGSITKETARIKEIYEQGVNDIDDVYNTLEKRNKIEPNAPNVAGFAQKTYVTWELNQEGTEYEINDTQTAQPDNWYDYENGKWANIKTTNKISDTETLEAYWVWIPRYEYIVPTSTTAEEIKVRFISTDIKEGSQGYIKQSDGTIKSSEGYTIHPAFTNEGNGGFGELDGIWVAKFEASSNTATPDENYGGGNDTNLKLQIKPEVQSWRNLGTKNMFSVCREITGDGEVLEGSSVDSHMMKNTEWGAVAILSQSKYGIFNPKSSTGANGDETYQVWNNPSSSYITGSVGSTKDDKSQTSVNKYNSANGPKASTTGTVYGVYDMAGGTWERVAGCLKGQENAKFGVTLGNTKYVDLYTNSSNSNTNYSGAKIGDATKETKGWNGDTAAFVFSSYTVFMRGDQAGNSTPAGVFAFHHGSNDLISVSYSFRVVLVP